MKKIGFILLKILGVGFLFIVLYIASQLYFIFHSPRELFFSQANKEQIETQLKQEFSKAGFKGDVRVTDYKENSFTGESIIYEYQEKVDGQDMTFAIGLHIDSEENNFYGQGVSYPVTKDTAYQTAFEPIIDEAMWKQPYVQEQMNIMKKEFERLSIKDMTFSGISGQYFSTLSQEDHELAYQDVLKSQDELFETFENNRKADRPLAGFYHVDVKHYLASHALVMNASYQVMVENVSNTDITDEIRPLFFEKIKTLDYSQFWDGYYTVGFSLVTEDGGYSGSITDDLILDIRGGKIYRTMSAI